MQKFSVLRKTAKKCKKLRAFARLFKPEQKNTKNCKNQHFQRNTSDFSVIPTQNQ